MVVRGEGVTAIVSYVFVMYFIACGFKKGGPGSIVEETIVDRDFLEKVLGHLLLYAVLYALWFDEL
jgi:hypothetical protein